MPSRTYLLKTYPTAVINVGDFEADISDRRPAANVETVRGAVFSCLFQIAGILVKICIVIFEINHVPALIFTVFRITAVRTC